MTGPKKNRTVCFDGKIIPVADLLKEIIVFHIKPRMWKEGDEDGKMDFFQKIVEWEMTDKKGKTIGKTPAFIAKIRKCDEETLYNISVEFMKFL